MFVIQLTMQNHQVLFQHLNWWHYFKSCRVNCFRTTWPILICKFTFSKIVIWQFPLMLSHYSGSLRLLAIWQHILGQPRRVLTCVKLCSEQKNIFFCRQRSCVAKPDALGPNIFTFGTRGFFELPSLLCTSP